MPFSDRARTLCETTAFCPLLGPIFEVVLLDKSLLEVSSSSILNIPVRPVGELARREARIVSADARAV